MAAPRKPPFRADHVGSLLRPPELKAAHIKAMQGELPQDALREIEDRYIREAIAMQESVGLYAITDGEFRRSHFHSDFLERLTDDNGKPSVKFKFRSSDPEADKVVTASFQPPTVQVSGKLRRKQSIELEGFKFLKAATSRTPKLTIPSPTMLLRSGRAAIDHVAYPDLETFYADIAAVYRAEIGDLYEAGCRYIQLDDTNFGYLCDSRMVEAMAARGEDAVALLTLYARVINSAVADRPADMVICIHICRGNGRGRWAGQGGYDPIAEVLFNEIAVDGYFLEYDTERAGGFEPLRHVPRNMRIVLGLLSSKIGALEDRGEIKKRIREAAKFMPLENLCLSPQCGFSSSYRGNPVTADDQHRKLAETVALAEEVWGTAQ